jgi:hypothetical protein
MKIAYIILAHKLPEQLVRLVKKLNTETTSFFIHVDKKTDAEKYRKMVTPLSTLENVHFLRRRVCQWGTFSQVQTTLDGIRKILELQLDFDYTILLTGQDYPIKSKEYIQKFFEKREGKSFLEYFPLPTEIWKHENGGMNRIIYWHLYFFGHHRKIFPRFDQSHLKLLGNFRLFGGSAYWCLSRDSIEYINEFLHQDDSFIKFWKYARIPDEILFQTILLNSHLKDTLINDNFRYIVWGDSSHPEILCKPDYEQLVNSNKLFARKFDVTIDSDVLDMIDKVTS